MNDDPASGRCARCRENTVLERQVCEACDGSGQSVQMGQSDNMDIIVRDCYQCDGRGHCDLTPCCGRGLVDEAGEIDEAYERGRDEGWPDNMGFKEPV